MPKPCKKKDARGIGRGVTGAEAAKPKSSIGLSLERKKFCGCHGPGAKLEGQHNPGKPISVDNGPLHSFLSINTVGIQCIINERSLQLTTSKANFELNRKDEVIRLNDEKAQRLADSVLRAEALKEQERQRLLDQQAAEKAREKARGFLSFKYGSSVEQRKAVGSAWTLQQLVSTKPAIPTVKGIKQSARQLNTPTPASIATLTNDFDSQPITTRTRSTDLKRLATIVTDYPWPNRQDYSPITPSTELTSFGHALAAPLTPAETPKQQSETTRSEDDDPNDMSSDQIADHDTGGTDLALRDVITSLYNIQQHIHQYSSSNQPQLHSRVEQLAHSLAHVESLLSRPDNPVREIKIAPEVIDYVEDGRNPDIYTRDFVELVLRGNALMLSKQNGMRSFSKIFAKKLKEGLEGLDGEVDLVMENAGMEERDGVFVEKERQNGSAA